METEPNLKVIIIGAGLGGLTCAIACRAEGFEVVVLERASRIVPMGAGIQIPPNGTKIARQLGFLDKLRRVAATIDAVELRRYDDGRELCELTGAQCQTAYGDPWMVAHRADFHDVLWRECQELRVSLCLSMEVERVDIENNIVYMEDGDEISGDVIIGADGPQSVCRSQLVGSPSPLIETGDVAYRAVFSREYLMALNDPRVNKLCAQSKVSVWLGPNQHTVFYPVRGGREFNLVLIRQDDREPDPIHNGSDAEEMRDYYVGWDGILGKILSSVPRVQKWKLRTPPKVEPLSKGGFALLGDAFHSSFPYHAQGVAMAMEDGASLGKLLGLAKEHVQSTYVREKAMGTDQSGANLRENDTGTADLKKFVPAVLEAYGTIRGVRVSEALDGKGHREPPRKWFHAPDGPEQELRDAELAAIDFGNISSDEEWHRRCHSILGHDAVHKAREAAETDLKLFK